MDSLSVKEEEELRNAQIKLASILARKARVEASLDLVASRHKLLQLAEDRVSTLPPARNDSDPSAATVSSKTKKGRGTVTSTSGVGPRCGYDERLSWEDEKLERWCEKDHSQAILKEELPLDGRLDDGTPMANGTASPAEGASSASPTSGGGNGTQQDAPLICSTAKRRCKRHADWSIVRGADFEVEREAQTQALSRLADEERDAAILIRELESIINIRRDTAQKAVARKKEEDAKRDAELAALLARGGTAARKASGPHFNL
ncbi:hypothetical protein IE53DRAFT_361252 [Violaceomyces palustris]|uniref:Uncharacterized protein n=1 Tax=Violaceomyces palustris TaxID=1673888 RepID=A0ACD0P160_9BASI|nr:hypothetical protein IE53DRAFT_361252 [Violaceomyces palustris]